jgi:hypothetical protein
MHYCTQWIPLYMQWCYERWQPITFGLALAAVKCKMVILFDVTCPHKKMERNQRRIAIMMTESTKYPTICSQSIFKRCRPSSQLPPYIGKKLLTLKPVVRTLRSYKKARLIKRQKSFQGLAMYGHEVFDVLTNASKVIRDTLFEWSCC